MNLSFISNTCVGAGLFHRFNIKPYNNPFISTLIPDDTQFVKLVNNLHYYASVLPVIETPKINYYNHHEIKTPYPVVFLDDIEIHCIHETDNAICLDKFSRRFERFKDFLKDSNNKVYAVLSFSELISNNDFPQSLITDFLQPVSTDIIKIFVGPTKWRTEQHIHYIGINEWDNVELTKNESNIFTFNDQGRLNDSFFNYINNIHS